MMTSTLRQFVNQLAHSIGHQKGHRRSRAVKREAASAVSFVYIECCGLHRRCEPSTASHCIRSPFVAIVRFKHTQSCVSVGRVKGSFVFVFVCVPWTVATSALPHVATLHIEERDHYSFTGGRGDEGNSSEPFAQ